MGAVAASLSGLGTMRSDINSLKEHMKTVQDIAAKLEGASKMINEQAEGAMKMKDELEQKLGGITSSIDSVGQLTNGLGSKLGDVESLIKKMSGGL